MKRTTLMLDEASLEEALRLSGERTYSAAVNLALSEFVRRARAGRILDLAGSGLREGNVSEMRDGLAINEPKPKVPSDNAISPWTTITLPHP